MAAGPSPLPGTRVVPGESLMDARRRLDAERECDDPPRPIQVADAHGRRWDPRHRSLEPDVEVAEGPPAWWVTSSRAEFSERAAKRAVELRCDPLADRVKTPVMVVGGMP
ncbi:MAG TPA: hypothetical protein VM364_07955 [Vicinamibacterales bacterium]|nr:hypothetical protein [Vicinamibacterales bacterium]